jgi:hypothetical protein
VLGFLLVPGFLVVPGFLAVARARARTAAVTRPKAIVASAEASRVPRAPRAATMGPPSAVSSGATDLSLTL